MTVNFSNEPVKNGEKSIFLAGPTMRNSTFNKSWRKNAVDILRDLNYSGIIYIPEFPNDEKFDDSYIEKQTRWEWEALDKASVIVFWIPRSLPDMPAFTTNVEFGRYITKKPKQVVLGFPKDAKKMRYLELLYKEITKKEPLSSLEETLKTAINIIKEDF